MPTYDYECENGHRFEMFQSMKDEPLRECTECGGSARRLIGPGAGFLFKGDGFYITDYRSEEYKKKASAEQPGGSSSSENGASSGSSSSPDTSSSADSSSSSSSSDS